MPERVRQGVVRRKRNRVLRRLPEGRMLIAVNSHLRHPRQSPSGFAVFTVSALLFGIVAGPLCRCVCPDACAASAPAKSGEAPCHAHHGAAAPQPAKGHVCEHRAGVMGTLPSPEQSPGPGVVSVPLDEASPGSEVPWAALDGFARPLPPILTDLGPPVPLPLFTILRA